MDLDFQSHFLRHGALLYLLLSESSYGNPRFRPGWRNRVRATHLRASFVFLHRVFAALYCHLFTTHHHTTGARARRCLSIGEVGAHSTLCVQSNRINYAHKTLSKSRHRYPHVSDASRLDDDELFGPQRKKRAVHHGGVVKGTSAGRRANRRTQCVDFKCGTVTNMIVFFLAAPLVALGSGSAVSTIPWHVQELTDQVCVFSLLSA